MTITFKSMFFAEGKKTQRPAEGRGAGLYRYPSLPSSLANTVIPDAYELSRLYEAGQTLGK